MYESRLKWHHRRDIYPAELEIARASLMMSETEMRLKVESVRGDQRHSAASGRDLVRIPCLARQNELAGRARRSSSAPLRVGRVPAESTRCASSPPPSAREVRNKALERSWPTTMRWLAPGSSRVLECGRSRARLFRSWKARPWTAFSGAAGDLTGQSASTSVSRRSGWRRGAIPRADRLASALGFPEPHCRPVPRAR